MENKPKIHYTAEYIINPPHRLTVNIIGAGGTGSAMLSKMAGLNLGLMALGHPGMHITMYDDDVVTEANVGRQLFYPADVGQNKAIVLISRINRSFGLNWTAIPKKYDGNLFDEMGSSIKANITISCVDTIKARKDINKVFCSHSNRYYSTDAHKPYYWMDCGNGSDYGQIYLGTVCDIEQPKSNNYETVNCLPSPINYFNGIKEDPNEPSCSLETALLKQDLYINQMIAILAGNMLWNLLKEAKTDMKGIYFNLSKYLINPINL